MKIAPFLAAAVLAGFMGSAEAAPVSRIDHLSGVRGQLGQVEKAQFVFRHRRYCFYPDGWHGPGFYWCGYAWRRGLGWGGPHGWHGWYVRPRHHWRPHSRPRHDGYGRHGHMGGGHGRPGHHGGFGGHGHNRWR
jgi:hypothetical protein